METVHKRRHINITACTYLGHTDNYIHASVVCINASIVTHAHMYVCGYMCVCKRRREMERELHKHRRVLLCLFTREDMHVQSGDMTSQLAAVGLWM